MRLPGDPASAYPGPVLRPALCLLLALVCSLQAPTLAQASPPQEVGARAEALYKDGKHLEAAQLYVERLNALPEGLDTRDQRNTWAAGAIAAYEGAFALAPTECATSHAGLTLADDYLANLVAVYGEPARDGDYYVGIRKQRDQFDLIRAQRGCPAPTPVSAPAPVGSRAARQGPRPALAATTTEPTATRRRSPGLAAGVGVSAALAAGMAIGTGILYSRLRKSGGVYYGDIQEAAKSAGVPTADPSVDMCELGSTDGALIDACQRWNSSHKAFLATAVLTGVFAASTAVFTGLLIRQRRQPGPTAAMLRRHQAQFGATPHLGGGASLTAGFQF